MAIHQLQVAFQAVPDRLLLRLSTTDAEEYVAHLTRRLVREMWPLLCAALERLPAASNDGKSPASAAGGRFGQPYQVSPEVRHPLGSTPLLVSEAVIESLSADTARLILHEHRGRSMTLTLDRPLFEVLRAMLRAAVEAADWNLVLAGPTAAEVAETPPATKTRTPTLH